MQTSKFIFALGLATAFLGCTSKPSEELSSTDSTPNAFISSSAAVEKGKDSTRRFIRTADLKFKVKSVIKSTYDIENITSRQGGFVTYTNLTSNINDVTSVAVSADSLLETTFYTVSNTITLRVPNTRLDTVLREVSRNIDYLDYRIISADDVALQILANDLTVKRSARNEDRLTKAIDNRGKKLNETTDAEEVVLSKQERADNARIANLSLKDQIKFSTIELSIYQRQAVKRELVSNNKDIGEFEPGLGRKLIEAAKSGWSTLETFLVFLTELWGIFLFVGVVYFLYRIYRGRAK